MRNPDDILAAPRHVRARLRLARKPRKHNTEDRGPFTRDDLLRHMRAKGKASSRKYAASKLPYEPAVYDYWKEFGSWRRAQEEAFGRDVHEVSEVDHKYIYDVIIQFDIWTVAQYEKKRAEWPDVMPSMHVLKREWGRWSNVKTCARRHAVALVIDDYLNLWRRLGRKPTLSDCRGDGLVIDKAVKFYSGKKKLDAFMVDMRRHE